MANRPLNVLLASSDRTILRQASRLLTVFGYQVRAVASGRQVGDLMNAEGPDVLLIDGTTDSEQALELCRTTAASSRAGCTYKMLLVKEMNPTEMARCLDAGVDDFLAAPLEHGELLARMRTAVRVLEFERRLAQQGASKPRLLTKQPFLANLESELAEARRAQHTVACIVMEVDHPQALRMQHGCQAGEVVQSRLEDLLRDNQGQPQAAARIEENRYAVLLRGTAEEAAAFAAHVREQFAACEFQAGEKRFRATVSCGISQAASGAATSDELLRHAETSLLQAQCSGGDFVACFEQFAEEDRQWADLAKCGALFENTLARDIMVPCTLVVHGQDTLAEARALFEQTRLQALPVVDDEGKLSGLVTASTVNLRLAAEDIAGKPVSSIMTSDVASFDERTTLAALIDYFTQESPLSIAIVNKGRPTGLVTPSSLATLGEQLTTESFAQSAFKAGRSGLVVPNLCGAEA